MQTLQSQTEKGIQLFEQSFGQRPEWKVFAPGRVNLIGEHTDYNLLPAMPMPLDKGITMLVRRNDLRRVRLRNVDQNFPMAEIDLSLPVEPVPSHWSNYCRAAVRAVVGETDEALAGFDAVVVSDLPAAAGLSSSSALVIATCLSFLQVNGLKWTAHELADRMRVAERFVGTAGGGMDQAVIALGQPQAALLVQFDPLHVSAARVPESVRVFVINSGLKAEKTGAQQFSYNRRSLECALGVDLIAQAAGANFWNVRPESLRDIYVASKVGGWSWQALVVQHLQPDPYTPESMSTIIGAERFSALCRERKLDPAALAEWLPDGLFQIFPRVMHVLSEAERVYEFAAALESADIPAIFALAKASHGSCRDLYHISTPGIEELVFKALAAGAGAARITGAGFGGCVVAFVPETAVDQFSVKLGEAGVDVSHLIAARSDGAARVVAL